MPCTAKKMEITWKEQFIDINGVSLPSVDLVLTTRELSRMIKQTGMNIRYLDEESFDSPFGISTGGGAIFGGTGGVMEAALRYGYEKLSGKELKKVEFEQIRGLDRTKIAEIDINGSNIKVAVANTLSAAREIIERWKSGEIDNLIMLEVMACPGGCLGGGGQPIPTDYERREERLNAIYTEDKKMTLRKSQDNPYVMKLYTEFLGKPGSELAHKLLHIHHSKRELFSL